MAKKKVLRLIKFGAPWCVFCREMDRRKVLERIAEKNPDVDVRRVDGPTDDEDTANHSSAEKEATKLFGEYGVESLPVLVVEDMEGNELAREEGAVPVRGIEKMLEQARRKLGREEEADG